MRISKTHPILSKFISIALASGILIAYILLTNPNRVALPLLLVPFVLIGIILYQATALLTAIFNREERPILSKLLPPSISLIGVLLMVLASLHQLTWKDTLLVILFTGLFWLYVWRADFLRKKS